MKNRRPRQVLAGCIEVHFLMIRCRNGFCLNCRRSVGALVSQILSSPVASKSHVASPKGSVASSVFKPGTRSRLAKRFVPSDFL